MAGNSRFGCEGRAVAAGTTRPKSGARGGARPDTVAMATLYAALSEGRHAELSVRHGQGALRPAADRADRADGRVQSKPHEFGRRRLTRYGLDCSTPTDGFPSHAHPKGLMIAPAGRTIGGRSGRRRHRTPMSVQGGPWGLRDRPLY